VATQGGDVSHRVHKELLVREGVIRTAASTGYDALLSVVEGQLSSAQLSLSSRPRTICDSVTATISAPP
jgi:hypothetical protein